MRKKINLVLFDMDRTLVADDTAILWCDFLDSKGILTPEENIKKQKFADDYHEHRLDVLASYQFEFGLMRKIPTELRKSWQTEFFENYVKEKISKKGLGLIQDYKKHPHTLVVLITASIDFIAFPVAQHAKVHDMIATEGELIDNQYTGRLLGIPNMGKGKVEKLAQWVIQKNITLDHVTLYSDSINDLPLLSKVHKPIVVDPDKYLEEIALTKHWEIMSFKDV